jgi:hypothetical protein
MLGMRSAVRWCRYMAFVNGVVEPVARRLSKRETPTLWRSGCSTAFVNFIHLAAGRSRSIFR